MNLLIPKETIIRDQDYLDFLKTERCLFTGMEGCDPAHIGTLGRGIKRSDDEAIPLHYALHRFVGHQSGEISMIRREIPNWLLRQCLRLYAKQMYREWKDPRP